MSSKCLATAASPSFYLIRVCNSSNCVLGSEVERSDILILCTAIAELFNHSNKETPKFESPEADAARTAIETIKAALDQQKDIRILTAGGQDVTEKALSADRLPFSEQGDPQDAEEIVLGVARRASDLSTNQRSEQPNGKAKPAILVTEQKSTRLKAGNQDIPTMSTSKMRTIIQALVGRRRSSSGGSSICHSGVVTPDITG